MGTNLRNVTDLQLDILKQLCESPANETATSLANQLHKQPETIWQSVQTLIKNGYVKKEQEMRQGNYKRLVLTDKGLAVAVVHAAASCGSFFKNNPGRLNGHEKRFIEIVEMLEEPSQKDLVWYHFFRYCIDSGLYQPDAKVPPKALSEVGREVAFDSRCKPETWDRLLPRLNALEKQQIKQEYLKREQESVRALEETRRRIFRL